MPTSVASDSERASITTFNLFVAATSLACISSAAFLYFRRPGHRTAINLKIKSLKAMSAESIIVPEGFTLHTENNSHILLPSTNEAFLNPVQEFNRDTSVACITVWSQELNRAKEEKWKLTRGRKTKKEGANSKRLKAADGSAISTTEPLATSESVEPTSVPADSKEYVPYKFVLLEALSATGLRSIRYAKEIPLVKHVIANDLSALATAAMKRNVEINGLGPASTDENAKPSEKLGKVRINEGDACTLMYTHREPRLRVDVVDLDPYGSAAPFIDAAVQCVSDNGLLCVTCTDLTVLATTNYPEKCFSHYGGVSVKTEYCHEAALRLVLNSIAASAARYGRCIAPLLSLSIDFYVRIFVKVHTSPLEVKKLASNTSIYYVCASCHSYYGQPMGKMVEKVHETSGNTNTYYKTQSGPPVSDKCPECGSALHIAGPMWSGPLHDKEYVSKVLEHLETNQDKYGTATRMKGMLTVAKEELDTPFYFTPATVAGIFHSQTPSLDDVASALLNGGHKVSRSHACAGSLKSTASRGEVFDVFRSWIKLNPVRMDRLSLTSPAYALNTKELKVEADFKRHPNTNTISSAKVVRYQQNPTSHWGPGTRASAGTSGTKRKRNGD